MIKFVKNANPQKVTSLLLTASSLCGLSTLLDKAHADPDTFIIDVYEASSIITADQAFTGSGILQKDGKGTLYLSEENTYEGGTIITDGKLTLFKNHALNTIPTSDSFATDTSSDKGSLGKAYYLDGSIIKRYDVFIGKSGITVDSEGKNVTPTLEVPSTNQQNTYNLSYPHNIHIENSASTISVGTGSKLTLNGTVESINSSGLTKLGKGEVILTGENKNFIHPILVKNGTLTIKNLNSIGDQLDDGSRCNLTLGNTTPGTAGTLNVMVDGTLKNIINLDFNSCIQTDKNVLLNGNIIGNNNIIFKRGAGKITLGGSSNELNKGIAIEEGTVSISSITNILNESNLGDSDTYSLTFNGTNPTLETIDDVTLGNKSKLDFMSDGSIAVSENKTFTFSGALTNVSNQIFTKSGLGKFEITQDNNSFYGNIVVSDGTLAVGTSNAIGKKIQADPVNNISAQSVGTITLYGTLANTSSDISLLHNINLQSGATISTPSNIMTLSGVISGGSDLTKMGSNEAVLCGTNNYTGKTIINEGTVTISAANNLGDTTVNNDNAVVIKPGAKLKISAGNFSLGRKILFQINS